MSEAGIVLGVAATAMAAFMTFVMWRVSRAFDRKYGAEPRRRD